MHEYGIVQQLVEDLCSRLEEQGVCKVKAVHIQRGSVFSMESLGQAYQMLTEGTALEGSELMSEEFAVVHTCDSCGSSHPLKEDDLIGHVFVCPECGRCQEVEEAGCLEITSVTIEGGDRV